jgi:hypothetical protein
MLLLDYDIINWVYGSPELAIVSLTSNLPNLKLKVDNATDPVNLHAAKGSLRISEMTITQLRKDIENGTANNDRYNNRCTDDDTTI